MPIPFWIKVRIFAVVALSVALFAVVGWHWMKPLEPGDALTVMFHQKWLVLLGVLVALSVISTVVAALVSGPYVRELAAAAVPAGLTAWAIMSGGIDRLLLRFPDLPERAGLFRRFVPDVLIWFAVVVLGYVVAQLAARWLSAKADDGDVSPSRAGESGGRSSGGGKKETFGPRMLSGASWMADVVSFGLTCAVSLLLVSILLHSGRVWVAEVYSGQAAVAPATGQIVLALGAAFALAAFACHQVFGGTLWSALLAVPTVAVVSYLSVEHNQSLGALTAVCPLFVPASLLRGAVLPIHYVAVGSLGVMAGHWFSVHVHLIRRGHHQVES